MKTKQVPAIIMLTAGLIVCIISIAQRMEFGEFVTTLFLVLICFYILGCIAKVILDKNFAEEKEEMSETDAVEGTETELGAETEGTRKADADKKENIESDGEEKNKTA